MRRDRDLRAVRRPAAASKHAFSTIFSELFRPSLTDLTGKNHKDCNQVDLSKAFDRVERPILFSLLDHCGVGDRLTEWVKVCYRETNTRLLVNGIPGERILIERSVRQGCPLSPLLFALYLELLCRAVLGSPFISRAKIAEEEVKVLVYADDIAILCSSKEQSRIALDLVDDYCSTSGASLNRHK